MTLKIVTTLSSDFSHINLLLMKRVLLPSLPASMFAAAWSPHTSWVRQLTPCPQLLLLVVLLLLLLLLLVLAVLLLLVVVGGLCPFCCSFRSHPARGGVAACAAFAATHAAVILSMPGTLFCWYHWQIR
jgi:hypothetical protein